MGWFDWIKQDESDKKFGEELEKQNRLEKERNKKINFEINSISKEIFEKLSNLFEYSEEKDYAIKIIKSLVDEGYFEPNDAVGYKNKVIKILREIDIIKKEKYDYRLKNESSFEKCTQFEEEPLQVWKIFNKEIDKGLLKFQKINLEKFDKRYTCKNCGYKWESKKKFGEPSICPKCKKDNISKFKTKEK